jgi:hypothetical protein
MNNMSATVKIVPMGETSDWIITKSFESTIQTPFKDIKGTKTIFPEGALLKGRKIKEVVSANGRVVSERESIQAPDKSGFYIIPMKNVEKAPEEKAETEIQNIEEKVAETVTKAVKDVKKLSWEKYTGFNFKQLVVITLISIVVVKTLK